MDESKIPSYSHFVKMLTPLNINPAELHGIISAYVAMGIPFSLAETYHFLFPKAPEMKISERIENIIVELVDYTEVKVTSLNFEFELMLPSDDKPLNTRAEALSLWCQGFMMAFSHIKADLKLLSTDSQDAIKYIGEIAKLDHDIIRSREEDEKSYIEIVEYLRMVVLLIYSDRQKASDGKTVSRFH